MNPALDPHSIKWTAKQELKEELFRAAVEAEKERLRNWKPWWQRLLPWTISIKRRVA